MGEQGVVSQPHNMSELVCRKQPQFFLEAQERLSGSSLGLLAVVGSGPTQPPHPFKPPITPWWGVLCHTGADQVFLHAAAEVLLPSLIFHVFFFLEIMSLVICGYMCSAGSHCGKGALVGVRCGGARMWATGIPWGSKELVPILGTWAGLCL